MYTEELSFKTRQQEEFLRQMGMCLKDLLENKILFQNNAVEPRRKQQNSSSGSTAAWFNESVIAFQRTPVLMKDTSSSDILHGLIVQAPVTVCTECEFCKGEKTPHNPLYVSPADAHTVLVSDQTFVLSYQCQKCKTGSLVFLVRRRGFKLQLVGRSQIPAPSLPGYYPSKHIALFMEAEMAFKTGSHLAAICLLRIALEQYLRAETGVNEMCSGEDLWNRFKKRLPKDFPIERVCGFGEVYAQLSAIIHTPALLLDGSYSDCKGKLDEFFKFLALMPLIEDGSGA